MKLLISAYACAPNVGSEHAVGWNWSTTAHRLGHQVSVLVSPAHRQAIETACRHKPELGGIRWTFPEVSSWSLQQGIEPKFERSYNLLWQRAALRHARELHRQIKFDMIHHLTWAGIRAPTFLGSIGPPLILGPVGGGETSPSLLRSDLGFRGNMLEKIRDLSTKTITRNPLLRAGFTSAAMIFASTEDTRSLFGGVLRDKTRVFTQVGLPELPNISRPRSRSGAPRFLYAGRLLSWKGVHISLRAFARIVTKLSDARFTVVGDGPDRSRLEKQARTSGVLDRIDFIPRLPQDKLLALYESHDLLLFPSLHDSGGFVVLEALARGLPVICLDLGGPGRIVTSASGIVVGTAGLNTEQVAARMAHEILGLLAEPSRLAALSEGAMARAGQFILSDRVAQFYDLTAGLIGLASEKGNSLRWTPETGQVAKRESSLGAAGRPKVRHDQYSEETQS